MIPQQHYGLPLAILPSFLALDANGAIAPLAAADSQVGHRALPQVQVVGATAIVPVCGMILKGISEEEEYCYGACNLARLDRMIENVMADPMIRNVVFDFNTPGGVTVGVESTARLIAAIPSTGKRTFGYTDTMCGSAGYWLMSACQQAIANPTAIVGSISTLLVAYDYSGMLEKAGVVAKVFRTGELKGAGVFGKPWTAEEEAAAVERMEFVDGKFKGFIAEKRGLAAEHMNGNYWYAENAPVRLVDALADSLEDVLMSLV